MAIHLNVMLGGEAGQGIQSAGFVLAKTLARGGYHIFADQDYESRVRGGHNFYRIRASDTHIGSISSKLDILIAFNQETISLHSAELSPSGVILYDSDAVKNVSSPNAFGVPLGKLAEESGGSKQMANTVALGAVLGLLRYDASDAEGILSEQFKGNAGDGNVKALQAGWSYAETQYTGKTDLRLSPLGNVKRMLINGNEAIALGAIAAGCKFMAAYPMTPVTTIMEFLASKEDEYGLVVVPAEDEIAAINMSIGASYAGVRAMTATSGSGFCLMTEGVGLAAITETPLVIVDGQRAGPAVGLPTRTEQGDLLFMIHSHHGDFPRAVLAPESIEDCFWMTVKAFNLADKYQIPVILLTDHHLASSYQTVEPFNLKEVVIDRGQVRTETGAASVYQRYQVTETGVSRRAFPGLGRSLVVADADEHDEDGHLIEDAETRIRMMDKRMRKLDSLQNEMSAPKYYSNEKPDVLLVGWGSTAEAIRGASSLLNSGGLRVGALQINELFPFPSESVSKYIGEAGKWLVVEGNATGQLARLIRSETGLKADGLILKYDGRPFTPEIIADDVRKEIR